MQLNIQLVQAHSKYNQCKQANANKPSDVTNARLADGTNAGQACRTNASRGQNQCWRAGGTNAGGRAGDRACEIWQICSDVIVLIHSRQGNKIRRGKMLSFENVP